MGKGSYVAYTNLPSKPRGEGPAVKENPVKLSDILYDDSRYRISSALIYGEYKKVSYLYVDLLWGRKKYQELRFVFVRDDGKKCIFVCTDLTADPIRIARAVRGSDSTSNACSDSSNSRLGDSSTIFGQSNMPRLNHFAKHNDRVPLAQISEEHDRELVLRTIKSTEGFVLFASIAIGILQMLSLRCADDTMKKARYLRTPSKNGDSEATVMSYLRRNIF